MARLGLASVIALVLCAGCATKQEVDQLRSKLAALEERATGLDGDVKPLKPLPESLAALTRRVGDAEAELATVRQNADAAKQNAEAARKNAARVTVIAADVDAVKVYLKQVAGRVREMRDEVVRILDEQNTKIDSGRKAYLDVLKRQRSVMDGTVQELERAIKELEKTLPKPSRVPDASLPDLEPEPAPAPPNG
jgi:chromosome segregation ATPase